MKPILVIILAISTLLLGFGLGQAAMQNELAAAKATIAIKDMTIQQKDAIINAWRLMLMAVQKDAISCEEELMRGEK